MNDMWRIIQIQTSEKKIEFSSLDDSSSSLKKKDTPVLRFFFPKIYVYFSKTRAKALVLKYNMLNNITFMVK